MAVDTSEKGFEANIESILHTAGYGIRSLTGVHGVAFKRYAIDVDMLFEFLEETQLKELERLKKVYAGDNYKNKILKRITDELKKRGLIHCLRHGIKDRGVPLRLVYNKPVTTMNQLLNEKYQGNIYTISRQVYYSENHNKNLDMVLFVNGFPVVVLELKNPLTNQTVEDAKKQFEKDRDPKEQLFRFNERVMVYFAVDTDEVFMTTELKKDKTFFLPFNKGNNGGKGNPPVDGKYRTHYLWDQVLQPDSLLDLIFKFVFIETSDILDSNGEKYDERKRLIFPRFHQLEVVRKLEADVKQKSVGHNYLVQHSAGSGKTNSISWLAHRLAKLHDEHNNSVFSSVIVITDRRVLDKQLQDAVFQLEHKAGVVKPIDKDSNQLAEAMLDGTRIIITTLQKFSFILEKVVDLNRKNYAVIIDEAHSSQGGKSSTALTSVLSAKTLEDAYREDLIDEESIMDDEEIIVESIMKTGKQNNVSFFAFTATPKPKTIEKFGTLDSEGKPVAFHQYTMRQAIEEKFILDVLANYTTYTMFYNIANLGSDDPEVKQSEATKKLTRYVTLHPHNIAQKTEIIIEHFREKTRHKINGRAKAMVVTGSRLHAVRYKIAFDKYIEEKGYSNLKTVVAFSGTVKDSDLEYTESGMNGFGDKELPDKFNSDEFKILLVAEKYQTGFDEPLLHTMYVDKKLSGIKAVQTLSRLNRTCSGKTDTFVLDFVNEVEDIKASFQPYYESTGLEEVTDPNILYGLQNEVEVFQIATAYEIDEVNRIEHDGGVMKSARLQGKLNALIDKGIERFNRLEDAEKDGFKSSSVKFIRTYGFVLQIADFIDVDLHKLYIYLNYLLRKLPYNQKDDAFVLPDDIALQYYRLQKTGETDISLEQLGQVDLAPTTHGTGGVIEDEKNTLSVVVEKINDRFGTDFTETDLLSYEQIKEDMMADDLIIQKAKNNTKENFKFAFEGEFINFVCDRMSTNEQFFMKILEDEDFKGVLMNKMMNEIYAKMNDQEMLTEI